MVPDTGGFVRRLSCAALVIWVGAAAGARAHTVTATQNISLGQVAAIGGTLTMSPTTGAVTGPGLMHVGSTTWRGFITVNRASSVTAVGTAPGGVTGDCGGASVVAHLNFDNSGCAAAGTGVCVIQVGAVIDLPNNTPAGSCSIPNLTVNVDFY